MGRWRTKPPVIPAEPIPISSLRERALVAAQEDKEAREVEERERAQATVALANQKLRNVLGIGSVEWEVFRANPHQAVLIKADIDGWAVYFDSANKQLIFGGPSTHPEITYKRITSLADWGKYIIEDQEN